MNREYSSFRDPSGYVFEEEGIIYRQINNVYKEHFDCLINSGLYETLVKSNLIVRHKTVEKEGISDNKYLVISPEKIPFISYPYEWSFDAYRDAALTTLKIQEIALNHGMTLKDASAYNIQFVKGRPVLIDTLSFEIYKEGHPWIAYGQFCRHFLAPLMIMARVDVQLGKMMMNHIDGIPLDVAKKVLKGRGGFAAWLHIKMQARSIAKHEKQKNVSNRKNVKMNLPKSRQIAIVQSLARTVTNLKMKNRQTEWGDYYNITNYNESSFGLKENLVKQYFEKIGQTKMTWDFGANDGTFSRIALKNSQLVVAFDIDPIAINKNYNDIKKSKEKMLPLLLDLTNPSPSIGFANQERKSIDQRSKPDVIIMLAIIHHLAISNNLPFEMLAQWLSTLCKYLIIEFVPKTDSQVEWMLSTREDIFVNYNIEKFEEVFLRYFNISEKNNIEGSNRVLYLFCCK